METAQVARQSNKTEVVSRPPGKKNKLPFPKLTVHQKLNILVAVACCSLLFFSIAVLALVIQGLPKPGGVCHNISESARTGVPLDVAPDPIYYNLCGFLNCRFDVSGCPYECPLGYISDIFNCPLSCACGEYGYFQGDIAYASDDISKLTKLVTNSTVPVDPFTLLNGGDEYFQLSTWGYGNDAVVPVAIDDQIDNETAAEIWKIISSFAVATCVKFVPYTDQLDYIKIYPSRICSSRVGRRSGENIMLVSRPCIGLAGIQHLFLHALGFYHEQTRPDRDDYVTVNWNNVYKGKKHHFVKFNEDYWLNHGVPYNTLSLLHFPPLAFARALDAPTMVGKKGLKIRGEDVIDLFTGMQESDQLKINVVYRCPAYAGYFDQSQWSAWTSWVSSYEVAPRCARMRTCIRTDDENKTSSGICLNNEQKLAKFEVSTADTCDEAANFTEEAKKKESDRTQRSLPSANDLNRRSKRQSSGTTNPRPLSSRLCPNGVLRAGYFNGDSFSDLLCIYGDGFMRLYSGSAAGLYNRLDWEGQTPFCKYDANAEIIVADLNGDGYHDLLCHRSTGVFEVIMLRNGIFPDELDWTGSMAGCYGSDKKVYVADVNGDGKGDLLCGDKNQFQLSNIFINQYVPPL